MLFMTKESLVRKGRIKKSTYWWGIPIVTIILRKKGGLVKIKQKIHLIITAFEDRLT